jgi:hypothetical protein
MIPSAKLNTGMSSIRVVHTSARGISMAERHLGLTAREEGDSDG